MGWILTWKNATAQPVEAAELLPLAKAERLAYPLCRKLLPVGNARVPLGDLFAVAGDGRDGTVILRGDLRPLRRVGQGMETGLLRIEGDIGPQLGHRMRGGTIEVEGSAGDGAGLAMIGGLIRIRGEAGDHLGGVEPGARRGMRDGVILVHGSIGTDAGVSMRRGLIAVAGRCGEGLGRDVIAGSLFAFGAVGQGLGVGMKRGTLALFGPEPPPMPVGFVASGHDRPAFLTIFLRRLREWGLPVPEAAFAGAFTRYNGDRIAGGQGEILLHRRD